MYIIQFQLNRRKKKSIWKPQTLLAFSVTETDNISECNFLNACSSRFLNSVTGTIIDSFPPLISRFLCLLAINFLFVDFHVVFRHESSLMCVELGHLQTA